MLPVCLLLMCCLYRANFWVASSDMQAAALQLGVPVWSSSLRATATCRSLSSFYTSSCLVSHCLTLPDQWHDAKFLVLMLAGAEGQRLMHALQQPSLAPAAETSQQQLDLLTQQPHALSERQAVISHRLRCLPLSSLLPLMCWHGSHSKQLCLCVDQLRLQRQMHAELHAWLGKQYGCMFRCATMSSIERPTRAAWNGGRCPLRLQDWCAINLA